MSFLGTGWSFPPEFSKNSGTVNMTSGEEDIRQSLEILFSTELGERLIEPDFGCSIKNMVFEPVDATLSAYMENLISDAITYHEPRIVLEEININEDPENGTLVIELEYKIPETNTRSNFVFPFYKDEGTDINREF